MVINPIHQINGLDIRLDFFAKPDHNGTRLRIDIFHQLDLIIPLSDVALVDAQCIYAGS